MPVTGTTNVSRHAQTLGKPCITVEAGHAGTSDADWAKTKGDVTNLSKAVLMNLAQRPGMEAMTKYRADKNLFTLTGTELQG